MTLTGELEGSFTAEIEEDDPDPERWSRSRRADFDFAGEFSATYSRDGLIDAWVYVGEPDENEWRRRLFLMEFDD